MGKKNLIITYFFILASILQVVVPSLSISLQKNNPQPSNSKVIHNKQQHSSFISQANHTAPAFDFLAEIEEVTENQDVKMLPFVLIKLSYGFFIYVKYLIPSISFPLQHYRGIAIFLFNSVFRI
jgi:hypothetical protein